LSRAASCPGGHRLDSRACIDLLHEAPGANINCLDYDEKGQIEIKVFASGHKMDSPNFKETKGIIGQ